MSEAVKIANNAPLVIERLIAEMYDGDWLDNQLLLGTLGSDNNDERIQVQLVVTRNPDEFMDE